MSSNIIFLSVISLCRNWLKLAEDGDIETLRYDIEETIKFFQGELAEERKRYSPLPDGEGRETKRP